MSKYKITDEVFFIYENKLCKGLVSEIKTITKSIWGIQLHNDKGKDSERKSKSEYIIVLDAYNKMKTNWIPERRLFDTKELLVESLLKNID